MGDILEDGHLQLLARERIWPRLDSLHQPFGDWAGGCSVLYGFDDLRKLDRIVLFNRQGNASHQKWIATNVFERHCVAFVAKEMADKINVSLASID